MLKELEAGWGNRTCAYMRKNKLINDIKKGKTLYLRWLKLNHIFQFNQNKLSERVIPTIPRPKISPIYKTSVVLQKLKNVYMCCINQNPHTGFKVNTCRAIPAHSAHSKSTCLKTVTLHWLPNLPHQFQSTISTKGWLLEQFVLETNRGKNKAPEGMTFPHCHQLYQGLIKYRLCAISVLTYLKAGSMGSVHRGHRLSPREGQVENDKTEE